MPPMRRLAAILALVLGLTLLAAPPASVAVAAHAENRASGSAAGLTTLIGIEARLSEEAVRENVGLAYDLASDDAVAARAGGATVRNAHLAGKVHPKTGIPFDRNGFPDFSSVSRNTVQMPQTGNRAADFAAANRAAGLPSTPRGYTWHHHQDGRTMQLVPTDIHRATGHTGGVALGGGGP